MRGGPEEPPWWYEDEERWWCEEEEGCMCICAEGDMCPREGLGGDEGAVPGSPWPFV